MSTENSSIKKDKKRRRRNYDDIDSQVQKLESSSVTKITDTTLPHNTQNLDDLDSDDLNDDELDRLMVLEEEKEKLVAASGAGEDDDAEEEDELDLAVLEDDADVPRRRTRGKVIDFKKTAELLEKEKSGEKNEGVESEKDENETGDDSDEDDADYVPEE